MRSVLRQRRWWAFSLFVVAMLALCVVLANWQWSRYQERRAENDRLDAALAAPTAPVDAILAAGPAGTAQPPSPADQWRMVTATGEFDPAGEVAVRRRPLDGRTGFWIVTPLRTETGILLVKTFQIAKAHGFQFPQLQRNGFQLGHGDTARFEDAVSIPSLAATPFSRSRHGMIVCICT